MKPEVRIALVKESERSKNVTAEYYPRNIFGMKLGIYSAILASLIGTSGIAILISVIAKHGLDFNTKAIVAIVLLFIAIVVTVTPWIFLIRREYNRKIQLLTEAILTVNESSNNAG
jgi:Ca2+/H+ antiporter